MCPEPSNVSGNGGASASGQPEISQEERQRQIQRFNELSVEQQDAALRYALNGSEAPSKNLNPTLDGAGIFGFGNAPTVDQQKLNEITNQMLNFTMSAGSLPFGMGTQAIENSIGQFFQAIMNCFKFEPLQLPSTPAAPSAPTTPSTQAAESPAAETPAADPPATPADERPTARPQNPSAQSQVSQKDSDYQRYGNGYLCTKKGDTSGARYIKHNGQWVKCTPMANGGYAIADANGKKVFYHANGKTTGQNQINFNRLIATLGNNSANPDDIIKYAQGLDRNTVTSLVSRLDLNKYNIQNNNGAFCISDKSSGKTICEINFNEEGSIQSVSRSNDYGSINASFEYGSNNQLSKIKSVNSFTNPAKSTEVVYGSDGSSTTTHSKWVQRGTSGGSYVAEKTEVKGKPYNENDNNQATSSPWSLSKIGGGSIPKVDISVSDYSTQGGEHIPYKGGTLYKNTDGSYKFVKGNETIYYDKEGNCTRRVISSDKETKTYKYHKNKYDVSTEFKAKN